MPRQSRPAMPVIDFDADGRAASRPADGARASPKRRSCRTSGSGTRRARSIGRSSRSWAAGLPRRADPDRLRRRRGRLHRLRAAVRGAGAGRHRVPRASRASTSGSTRSRSCSGGRRSSAGAGSCPQARGEKLATFGLTEPGVGTDAANLQSTARRVDGGYVLNGQKIWISLADIADHFLVFATVDRATGWRGITAFLLERGMPGLTTGTLHGKLGIRAGNTGLLTFEDLFVPEEHRLGEEGEGFLIAMSAIDQGRYTVAAGAVGLAQACLDASRAVRARAPDVRRGDRPPPARQADDREDGRRDRRRPVARLAGGCAQEPRPPEHARDVAREMARHGPRRRSRSRRHPDPRRQRLLERVSRRALPAQCEGRRRSTRGRSQLHTLIQADYALGYREDRPLRCEPWPAQGFERA